MDKETKYKVDCCLLIVFIVALLIFIYQVIVTQPSDNMIHMPNQFTTVTAQAEIVDTESQYWYASGPHYKTTIQVYCSQYNLYKTFTFDGKDALKHKDKRFGDIVSVNVLIYTDITKTPVVVGIN